MALIGLGLVLSRFDFPFPWQYPLRGIDVSRHQGLIDWTTVAGSGRVDFAYIKATEGRDYVDPHFRRNREKARKTGITTGAYHFFSLHNPGLPQAEHFLRTVMPVIDELPPAVDLEFEANGRKPPGKAALLRELAAFDRTIRATYGNPPVYYLNEDFLRFYFTGRDLDNPLWIRGIYHQPAVMKKRGWAFWQYSDFGRVPGIRERVDLNVFRGSRKDLEEFCGAAKHCRR